MGKSVESSRRVERPWRVAATDPLPPGANSCAVISRVTPPNVPGARITQRQSHVEIEHGAPPRDVARESPMVVEIRFSGASGGRSIFRELDGSSVVSCALKVPGALRPTARANTKETTAVRANQAIVK